jgi:hypothetical protein
MDQVTAQIIIALVALAIEKGPGVASSLIAALNKEEITVEDIEALKITKEPEEF